MNVSNHPSNSSHVESSGSQIEEDFSTWIEQSMNSTHFDDYSRPASSLNIDLNDEDFRELSLDEIVEVHECLSLMATVWPKQPACTSQTIGPYHLVRKLGSGGMGEVWAAEQKQPIERKLALKLIRKDLFSSSSRNRFISERKLLAQLEHPNIARIIDAGETDDGQLYFAMELVEGQTINDWCSSNRIPPKDRARIFVDACSAVGHAHRKGIIHRDLKPANILVTEIDGSPVPKVIDFGLAKLLDERDETIGEEARTSQQKTQTGDILGTVEYMSPEQAAGDHNSVDTRSDVYSLGVVLYSLFTSTTPVKLNKQRGESKAEVLKRIAKNTPRPPSDVVSESSFENLELADSVREKQKLVKELRTDLDWITMKALATSPDQRYSTVESLADDLRKYLDDQTIAARPSSLRYSAGKFLKRNMFAAIATGLLLALLLGGAVGTTTGWINSTRARKLAETNLIQARNSNQVLTDIFSDFDIRSVEQTDKPVRILFAERLQRAGQQIIEGSTDEPREIAKTLNELSKAMSSLGFAEDAVPICEHAVRLSESEFGQFAPLTREIKFTLADIFIAAGEYGKCENTLEPLLEFCRTELLPFDEETICTTELFGKLKTTEGDHETALASYQESQALREQGNVGTKLELANTKMGVAECLSQLGNNKEATPLYEEVLSIRREKLPSGHPDIINTIAFLSIALEGSPNPKLRQRASDLTEEAFQLSEMTYGKHHRETYYVQARYANNLAQRWQHQQALQHLNQAYNGLSEICSPDHHQTVYARSVLQQALSDTEDFQSAIPLAVKNSELLQDQFEAGHPKVISSLVQLSQLFVQVGEFEKALQQLDKAKTDDLSPGDTHKVELQVGRTLLAQQKFPEARRVLENLVATIESTNGVVGARMKSSAQINLAQAESGAGNHQQAIEILERTTEAMKRENPQSGFLAVLSAHRGIVLARSGMYRAGIDLMESFARSGQTLSNRDYLFQHLHDAYMAEGQRERIAFSLGKSESFVRRSNPANSMMLARKLATLGLEAMRFELWETAKPLLADSQAIVQRNDFDSWHDHLLKFQLATVNLGLTLDREELSPEDTNDSAPDFFSKQLQLDSLRQLHTKLSEESGNQYQRQQSRLEHSTGQLIQLLRKLGPTDSDDYWQSVASRGTD